LAIISKSGTTTESIAMAEAIIEKVRKHKKDYSKSVVVITDNDTRLMSLAKSNGFDTIAIPKKIGDRYSVLSPLGLFPLTMLNLKPEQLLLGAASMREKCLNSDTSNNPAAISAAISYLQFKKGKNIHDTFLFSQDLEALGKWCRQVSAESLGKEKDKNGTQVFTGPTPTVSIGSLDLHIVTQLYLGGPFDKYTMFVKVEKNRSDVKLPNIKEYDDIVEGIQGLELKDIMDAIYEGTKIAFEKGNRPYSEVILPDKSESSISQFMQFKMFETIYLASLLNVNPYDQPNVESYKEETRKILAGKKR
jgi:glucose-6-phosphate isomerase